MQLTATEGPAAGFQLKMDLPPSWLAKSAAELVAAFEKRARKAGRACGPLELLDASGTPVAVALAIGGFVSNGCQLRLRPATTSTAEPTPPTSAHYFNFHLSCSTLSQN